jgi:hypothetical protein
MIYSLGWVRRNDLKGLCATCARKQKRPSQDMYRCVSFNDFYYHWMKPGEECWIYTDDPDVPESVEQEIEDHWLEMSGELRYFHKGRGRKKCTK